LIADPGLVVQILLGPVLPGPALRLAAWADSLLSLGLACWPNGDEVTVRATWVLFFTNLLASLYLCYLRVRGGFTGYVLWLRWVFTPFCASVGAPSGNSDFSVEDCLTCRRASQPEISNSFENSGLDVEFEEEDVAVFDDVLFAFGAEEAGFLTACRCRI